MSFRYFSVASCNNTAIFVEFSLISVKSFGFLKQSQCNNSWRYFQNVNIRKLYTAPIKIWNISKIFFIGIFTKWNIMMTPILVVINLSFFCHHWNVQISYHWKYQCQGDESSTTGTYIWRIKSTYRDLKTIC